MPRHNTTVTLSQFEQKRAELLGRVGFSHRCIAARIFGYRAMDLYNVVDSEVAAVGRHLRSAGVYVWAYRNGETNVANKAANMAEGRIRGRRKKRA